MSSLYSLASQRLRDALNSKHFSEIEIGRLTETVINLRHHSFQSKDQHHERRTHRC